MVRYENGKKDVFAENKEGNDQEDEDTTTAMSKILIFNKGIEDAKKHYKGDNQQFGRTFLMTIVTTPIGGVITAAHRSNLEPFLKEQSFPDKKLVLNEEYLKGYKKEARRQNRSKAWGGFFLGLALYVEAVGFATVLTN